MSLNLDSLPSVWLLPDSPQREPRVGRFECSNQGGKSKIEGGSTNSRDVDWVRAWKGKSDFSRDRSAPLMLLIIGLSWARFSVVSVLFQKNSFELWWCQHFWRELTHTNSCAKLRRILVGFCLRLHLSSNDNSHSLANPTGLRVPRRRQLTDGRRNVLWRATTLLPLKVEWIPLTNLL